MWHGPRSRPRANPSFMQQISKLRNSMRSSLLTHPIHAEKKALFGDSAYRKSKLKSCAGPVCHFGKSHSTQVGHAQLSPGYVNIMACLGSKILSWNLKSSVMKNINPVKWSISIPKNLALSIALDIPSRTTVRAKAISVLLVNATDMELCTLLSMTTIPGCIFRNPARCNMRLCSQIPW